MATWGPVVQGSVEPMTFTAEVDGSPVDLTSYGTITPIVTNGAGAEVAQPGTAVKITPQTGSNIGKLTYTPHADTWTRTAGMSASQPERFGIRFKILDGGNVPLFFPGGDRDAVLVHGR